MKFRASVAAVAGLWWVAPACAQPAAPTGKMESLSHVGSVEKAYIALPAVPPVGGLVLVPDWWGMCDAFIGIADGYAKEGYVVVAVDFYDGKVPKAAAEAQIRMNGIHRPGALRIVHSAVRLLREDKRVQVPKIGIVGWSYGAGLALETAIGNPDIAAVVLYYGPVILDKARLQGLAAPLLGIYAKRDAWITPEIAGDFRNALRSTPAPVEFLEVDAAHMFANPASGDYDAKGAQRARQKALAFLRKNVFVVIAPPAPAE